MIRFRRIRTRDGGREVTATIVGPGPDDEFDLFFRSNGPQLVASPEALIVLALPVAMGHGVDIKAPGRVAPQFLDHLDEWQRAFSAWLPDSLRRVSVSARTRRPRAPAEGSAAFFTGGADSFYTVLKHQATLDRLVYVWGFDVPLHLSGLRRDVAQGIRAAATDLDVPLVEVETNLREWSDRNQSVWGMVYSAVALAAIAHAMSPTIGTFQMASLYSYRDLFAWGSTPLTDRYLGSDRTAIIHDGCEADRVERIATLAESPTAMRHLRVCWENRGGRYNCGVCGKCVRTMIALRICKALDRCETMPDLDLAAVEELTHTFVAVVPRLTELIEHLRINDDDPELLAACEKCLRKVDPEGVRWDLDFRDVMPLLFG